MVQFVLYSTYVLISVLIFQSMSYTPIMYQNIMYVGVQIVFFLVMFKLYEKTYDFKKVKEDVLSTIDLPMSKRPTYMKAYQWAFVVLVYLMNDALGILMPTGAYIVSSFINMAFVYVLMYPVFIESNIKFKTAGVKRIIFSVIIAIFVPIILSTAYSTVIELLNIAPDLTDSVNQTLVVEEIFKNPMRMLFTITFGAAFFEEVIFRGLGFRTLYHRNKWFAYLFTFLLFATPHLILGFEENGLIELVFLPIYGMMGLGFAYAYAKTESIYTAMIGHFLNNLLSFVAIITDLIIMI